MLTTQKYKIKQISSIEVENFKSFGTNFHKIGPFLNLTSIIGPNGGGKSNILDAICFALCVSLKKLRSNSYRDFIYKPSNF